jgi:prophage tail gpP-like protein
MIAAGAMILGTAGHAQEAPSLESRLRDQLKVLMSRTATAEAAQLALQAEKTALEEKVKALEKRVEEIGKQLAADREAAKAESEKLKAELAARDEMIAQTKAQLVKATDFGTKAAEMLKKTEAERAQLAAEAIQLKRVVADQRVKNGKMFEIGNEILTRYQKFGLGTALTAREPFVGITRARLETMVEEYGGQLAEQRLKAVGNTPPTQKPATSETKRPKD